MEKILKKQSISQKKMALNILKIIIFSYILTGLFLFLLAFLMYKFDLKDNTINIAIIIIMIICTFIGGLLSAKVCKKKKWLYGMIVGISYFLILVIISLFINKDNKIANDAVTIFIICLGSGTIGGMIG